MVLLLWQMVYNMINDNVTYNGIYNQQQLQTYVGASSNYPLSLLVNGFKI